MKKHLKFLFLIPFLFAVVCESDDFICEIVKTEQYILNVENINETYSQTDIIWINSQIGSILIDSCTESNSPELITDIEIFQDGFFILRLGDFANLNAQVVDDATIIYDIGSVFNSDSCNDVQFVPELTADNQFYRYRIGINITVPGDYCIVNARDSFFNRQNENNDQIFAPYDILNNEIRFQDCGNTFVRNNILAHYFFRVN